MSDRQALLLAIRAAPDDDLPRLAYADWLEENGDPGRAQFIRVQCALARLAPDEDEHDAVYQRSEALAREHAGRWAGELPSLDGVSWSSFTRGFVEGATATSWEALVREAGRIREAILLRDLWLRLGTNFSAFRHPECLESIERLTVRGRTGLSPRGVRALAALPQLRSLRALDLSNQRVTAEGAEALAASPQLAGLEELDLGYGSGIGPGGAVALARSPHLRRLRELSVAYCGLDGPSAAALLGSPVCAGLRRLTLDGNPLTDEALRALAASMAAGLEDLSLEHCDLPPGGLRELLSSPVARSLRRLSLRRNTHQGPELAEAVAASPGLGHLRTLNMDVCQLGDAGAAALARSPHLVGLRHVSLDTNAIGDAGATALAGAPWVAQLRRLGLRENWIDAAGAQALAASWRGEWRGLLLSGNDVRDYAWEWIRQEARR